MIKKRKAYMPPTTVEIQLWTDHLLIGVSGKSGKTSDGTGIENGGDDDGSATPAAKEYGWDLWDVNSFLYKNLNYFKEDENK